MNGELPIEVKKRKKVKRVMTPEQKAAAAERLAKARAARKTAPPSNVHPSVLALEPDHPLSLQSVRNNIRTTREKITAERQNLRMGAKGAEARIASMEGYIRHLNAYITNGDYIDDFYGEEQQHKVNHVCLHPSYNQHGDIKRTVGTWYRDIANVWTKEMDNEWRKTRGY